MDKIKMFFANIIAKIKGLFKKEKPVVVPYTPPPVPKEPPVVPQFDKAASDEFWRQHDEMSGKKYLDFGPRAPGNEVDK